MSEVTEFVHDPGKLEGVPNEAVHAIPVGHIEEEQLGLIGERFAGLRHRIGVLDRLADDLRIGKIDSPEDVIALCFPHTFYKAYSVSDVERRRFDRMTRWLGSLTSVDLSAVDTSGCDSLESWMGALRERSSLRPLCSSGTSGKMSFFPRSTTEEQIYLRDFLRVNAGYRDEADSGLASGEVDMLAPWPVATGSHNVPTLFRLLRENVYNGRPGEHLHTLGRGHWNLDLMWFAGRVRAAEAKGHRAATELAEELKRLQETVAADQTSTADNVDRFMTELLDGQRGRKIFLFAPPREIHALAVECAKRGRKPELAEDSYIFSPGRADSKGGTLPDGWLQLTKSMFPGEWQGVYAMTECTAAARLCRQGHYHMPPWIYLALLDPDTSRILSRDGIQTGRLALFDLLVSTHWGGTITGDRVTIDWRGGCGCGREGPFIHNDVVRYGNLQDDDKITCSKTPDAYDRAVDFVLGALPD